MISKLYKKLFGQKVQVNNQKDLSLGYTHISFDASVLPNGHLGIGMHDITNNVKKHSGGKVSSFSSSKGERAALLFSLDYAKENNLVRLNLYTDNLDLATKGIKKLLKNYNFEDVHLTWIPRELNSGADKLSKQGQKINLTVEPVLFGSTPANETKKKKVKKTREALKDDGSLNSLTVFANYTMEQKVKMLKSLSNDTHNEKEFIRMLENQEKSDYKFQVSNSNMMFIRMARTLLMNDPKTSKYVRNRFKKLKNPTNNKTLDNTSNTQFEKEFDKRKPANLVKKKQEIEPRTSYMIEMVEAIKGAA